MNWRTFNLVMCFLQPCERMKTFESRQVVRGHHVYKAVQTTFIGEILICRQESGNASNLYAVAVLKPASSASSSPMVVGMCHDRSQQHAVVFLGHNSLPYNWTKAVLDGFKAGWLRCSCMYTFIGENHIF